jgi:hypothetical protein
VAATDEDGLTHGSHVRNDGEEGGEIDSRHGVNLVCVVAC